MTAHLPAPAGSHADASPLQSLAAKMAGYEQERAAIVERIAQLERQQQRTEADHEILQWLQQKENSLLDFLNKLQQEKILLLGGAGESLALSVREGVSAAEPWLGQGCMFKAQRRHRS